MSHADPTGPMRRRGPAVSMSPKAIADIRDDEVRALKQREVALRAELANLRTETRTALQNKDAALRKLQAPAAKGPAGGKSALGQEFDALMRERDELNAKFDKLRLEQTGLSRLRDDLRSMDYEGDSLLRDLRAAEGKMREAQMAAERAADTRDRLMASLTYKTISDADEEIAHLESRIAAATKRNDMGVVRELTKSKSAAEKAKKAVQQSYAADEEVLKRNEQAKAAEQHVANFVEKKRSLDGKKTELREKLSQMGSLNKEFDAIRTRLNAIRTKMDKVKEAMRNETKAAAVDREDNSGIADARAAVDAARAKQDAVTAELDEIAGKVPSVEIPFSADLRQEILGRGGATLDQLRADFGVAIEFTPDKTNCLTVVGAKEDCDATKAAVDQMLENLALCRKTATVTFDPSIAPSLIGARGSNIERIQNISGAKIKVTSSEGTANIVGTQEAVDAAEAMIKQHVANSAQMAMKFDRELRDVVVGKGGATIRKIEEESGAKKIRVDRDACIISAFGTQEACDKVKKFYTELLGDLQAGGMTMRVDQRMVALIIGKGGSTIADIQNTTGAIINIGDGGKVSIRGSRDAVQAARERVEDLTRREEIKIPYPRALWDLLTTRPLVAPEGGEDGERVQQEERNSPLEEIKFQCGCDQVSAIRSEANVVIRGRREAVAEAKRMLAELLHDMKPETKIVAFPDVLSAHLTRRSGTDRMTTFDRLKAEHPGVYGIDMDRKAGTITVSGEGPAVDACAKALGEVFDAAKDNMGSVAVAGNAIGAVIGTGGQTIADLQRRHKADINVSREKGLVTVYCPAGQDGVAAVIADVEAVVKGEPMPSKAGPAKN
eukprot:CAMPEP_0174844898 /NCGR_PEP_ID=MMETSP1114-20130205/11390_1 /TAXON_ID=312471 /ORGANISM="Neobodo designis, Strain CCAP 1951/1" /LENGTH=838 /DNA_ID=CAMNT_0016079143 /DNA_START=29 /DNA_END=2545 /DNA_ORIENTATION=+